MSEPDATRSRERLRGAGARTFVPVPLAPWLRRLGWRGGDVGTALRETFEGELGERAGILWLATCFATGALVYFSLPREPLLSALAVSTLFFSVVAVLAYRHGAPWRVLSVIALLLAGATVAKLRVDHLVGPEIERPTFAIVTGRVVDRESRADLRPRIVLDGVEVEGLGPAQVPERIRVTLSKKQALPPLGVRISFNARLMPVGGPIVPGGYDPHRAAFFDRIGASGFMLGAWKETTPAPESAADLMIPTVRALIVDRIVTAIPGEPGAVAAALLVGERSGLSEETNESLRISGLAHILSISGLHMMLVAGSVFFVVRALLALSPRLTLTWPIKKLAAAAALAAVTVYLALSGGGAATVRSYVMAAIMFGAVLVDRPAISMRNLAIAVFVVLALEPEGVVEPGFQMSFAAVAALIAGWEYWRDRSRLRLSDNDALPGLWFVRAAARAVAAVAITTLIAGAATAPFAAYHFERIATYSLLGNLLAAPLVSAIIMPFGLIGLAAMPFGLETLPLTVMGWGIALLLEISAWVASLPGADANAPPMGAVSLMLIVAGMVWLCLWRRKWRMLGLPAIAAGLVSIPMLTDRADILVSPDGRAVAVRDADGVLRVSGARAGSYVVEQFFDEEPRPLPDGTALRAGIGCDGSGCVLQSKAGTVVAHVREAAAFAEDCGRASVVVTALAAPLSCHSPLLIDARRLEAFGAHAVRIRAAGSETGYDVTTDRSVTPRPWQATGGP